jgi:hypothetical protein
MPYFCYTKIILFQSIQWNTIVLNPNEINFTQQNHLETNHNSSKINQRKLEFSCVASYKFPFQLKPYIHSLLKAMIIHQNNGQFLIIVDLENFWNLMAIYINRPRPRTRKTPFHSKFFISKSIVISYNISKSFTLTIQNILDKTTNFDNFKFVSLRHNQLFFFSNLTIIGYLFETMIMPF